MMTAEQRAAALQYSRPFRITLPIPSGVTSKIIRAHAGFSYFPKYIPAEIGIPHCGWIVEKSQMGVWWAGKSTIVFNFGACR